MKIQDSTMKTTGRIAAIPLAVALALGSVTTQASQKATGAENTLQQAKINKTATKKTEHKKKSSLISQHKQVVKEAADAFTATETALLALHNKQAKHAQAALEIASGNLHLLLARDPALSLVPIDVNVEIIEGVHDLKTIKKLQDELEDLIDDKRFQDARPIIDSLVDELRVTTVYLPLATYPATIDSIAPLVDAGKWAEAEEKLVALLDTFVLDEEITPLAIIRAEEKINKAFQIEYSADFSKDKDKNQISQLIKEARQHIKIAEALGYASEYEYKPLYDDIDELKKAIGTNGFKGEWAKIKQSMSSLKNKVIHPRD
ncbi:MAG: hypothetical protein methR_P1190 [Methyloprofundus sp.]|nr:MAG: hypothetical protein methR_P1190 [Methyloprofundus sp.]